MIHPASHIDDVLSAESFFSIGQPNKEIKLTYDCNTLALLCVPHQASSLDPCTSYIIHIWWFDVSPCNYELVDASCTPNAGVTRQLDDPYD